MSDTERLDFIERQGFTVSCQWKNTGWAGGPKWKVYQYDGRPFVAHEGDTLREAVDKARSGQEKVG